MPYQARVTRCAIKRVPLTAPRYEASAITQIQRRSHDFLDYGGALGGNAKASTGQSRTLLATTTDS